MTAHDPALPPQPREPAPVARAGAEGAEVAVTPTEHAPVARDDEDSAEDHALRLLLLL